MAKASASWTEMSQPVSPGVIISGSRPRSLASGDQYVRGRAASDGGRVDERFSPLERAR
jgi:hypothetical protein